MQSLESTLDWLRHRHNSIQRAIEALQDIDQTASDEPSTTELSEPHKRRYVRHSITRRTLSAESRKRLSDAMKRRWAESRNT